VITVALIAINLYVYYLQDTSTQAELGRFISQYALVPARFTEQLRLNPLAVFFHHPLVTSTFLHGSWFHVIFNMLYLWIFADNIEDRLGRPRFILFYLLAGIAGNLAHILLNPGSPIPLVGASGAIAGVLGAYIITFPRARITSLLFIFFFITIRDIPAIYFLLFWFLLQVINGVASLGIMGNNVAYWAHIGGFLSGVVLMLILKKKNSWQPRF
jgi:membrane associated rhomboid family serine protease